MKQQKKVNFLKEIYGLMYGYGDVRHPISDSAFVLHEYTIAYLKNILLKTKNIAKIKGKIKTEDLMYVIKRDKVKYNRVKAILRTSEELKEARKAFEVDDNEKKERERREDDLN